MNALSRAIDRFCYKHPRFGIPRLMQWIVIGNAAVYILYLLDQTGMFLSYLTFSPQLIMQGQVWRIITFLFIPNSSGIFFTAISLYFYYFIGSTLERQWGTAKFSFYYLLGVLLHIVAAMVIFLTTGASMIGMTAHYLNLSMFFAFATLYPNMQVMLFFIIPIKIKWLAWLDAAYFLIQIILYFPSINMLLPVLALLNYIIFFGGDLISMVQSRLGRRPSAKTVKFRSAAKAAKENKGYLHKCTVCGKTDTDYPGLEFRYCSKCNGYYCYCKDHISSHAHVE